MTEPAVIVIAKAPVAGRVKTRLTPPLTPEQAASVARAALCDTLAAALASRAHRVVLALAGERPRFIDRYEVEVIAQRGAGLEQRIASAFADVGEPAVLVGMDTPQVTPRCLDRALDSLRRHDAVLGPAGDGGYWTVGLNEPRAQLFHGIAMSTSRTGADQLARLRAHGLDVDILETLCDFDDIASACDVATAAPHSRFAAALGEILAAAGIAAR